MTLSVKCHLIAAAMAVAPLIALNAAQAADPDNVNCHLDYNLSGWSALYKTAQGTGTVSCDNGTTMPVKLDVKGGGLTAGTSHISNGHGNFTGVDKISDVLGNYASAGAEAGAAKAGQAKVLTNGNVSLALAGSGSGWGAGVTITRFNISRSSGTTGAGTP